MNSVKSGCAAVIGGGFAGLAAATALAEAGVRVQVFEARPTLGGRANAFRDPVTGERIDNGQHVLAGCYDETLCFLRRIGATQNLHWPSTLRIPMIDEAGRASELVLPPLPAPVDLIAAVLAWDALTAADRWSVVRLGRALRSPSAVRAHETVRQWLERHRQTPRLCRLLWEPLALAALNQSIDHAAAAAFVAVTARMFASSVPHAATLLLPAVPLDQLYVVPANTWLARAGSAVSAHAKATVVFDRNRVAGVRVAGETVPSDVVICAVPWFALADVLASGPNALGHLVECAMATKSSPIVTVNLWFDDGQLEQPLVGLPGRTFQWVFDRRRLLGAPQSHLSLVSSGADAICQSANDHLVDMARRELSDAVPVFRRRALRHALVVRERRATFLLDPGGPPRPGTTTPVPGLFLAGDWIDTGLPATIESAVASGHRAAAAALAMLPAARSLR